jgi:hypothetical protein
MSQTDNQEFGIVVWYRTFYAGEQEKDFDFLKIKAQNVQEAVNIVADEFKSKKAIPFSYEHQGKKYSPTNFNKQIVL